VLTAIVLVLPVFVLEQPNHNFYINFYITWHTKFLTPTKLECSNETICWQKSCCHRGFCSPICRQFSADFEVTAAI
jgi:hypothetical protein